VSPLSHISSAPSAPLRPDGEATVRGGDHSRKQGEGRVKEERGQGYVLLPRCHDSATDPKPKPPKKQPPKDL